MVKKISISQFKSKIRQAQNKQKQAINKYNQEVRKYNRGINREITKYNQEVRAYNNKLRSTQARIKNELSKLNRISISSKYDYYKTSVFSLHDSYVHLGNISRLNRNYIHPGKELRENDPLNFIKANLCFSATLEILRAVT